MIWAVAFALLAILFVAVSGANDGATLVGLGLRFPQASGVLAMAILLVTLVAVPLTLGTVVAETFTAKLADFGDDSGAAVFLAGTAVSLIVVGLLAWRGLPTSLTLALIGGITGAGFGAGLDVSWIEVGKVLGLGVAAPVAGAVLAYLLGLFARRFPTGGQVNKGVLGAHLLAYTGQCVAYAANDGQKMIAVGSVAAGVVMAGGLDGDSSIGVIDTSPGQLAVLLVGIAVVFGASLLGSVLRIGERLGRGIVLARPMHVVTTEASAAVAVFGSALVGVPVSMSQSVTAGVVGVAATEGLRRVRWQHVAGVGLAWLCTLPSALALGFGIGKLVELVVMR